MTTPTLRPGQVVTWFPVAGQPGIKATVQSITQRSALRPAQVKVRYIPRRCRNERTQQLPLALFLACLTERPHPQETEHPS